MGQSVNVSEKAFGSAPRSVRSPSAYAVQFAEALTLLGRARCKFKLRLLRRNIEFGEAVKLYRELAKSESSVTNVSG